jgi:hypothetical protein
MDIVQQIKRQARLRAAAEGTSHQAELNAIAREHGHAAWGQLLAALTDGSAATGHPRTAHDDGDTTETAAMEGMMKDWTGQEYDAQAVSDVRGTRADYDTNLIRRLDPHASINISGTTGGTRPAARCQTGFVLSANATCEKCGAGTGDPCRSSAPGTAGHTAGVEPPISDAEAAERHFFGLLRERMQQASSRRP